MRIREMTLGDREIKQVDGEWKDVITNEETIPLYLTNYSLKYGKDKGFLEKASLEYVFDMITEDKEKCYTLLYLAAIGANPEIATKYTIEAFINRMVLSPSELLYKAQSVTNDALPDDYRDFIKELEAKTNKEDSKKK